jgi:two-component system, chemotaxis family, chemotaxis protein CheY
MFPLDTRILLLDDTELARQLLRHHLTTMGFTDLSDAPDVATALRMMNDAFGKKKPFGLIMSDYMMPDVTGMEFLNQVRSDDRFKSVPFIMITAENDAQEMIKAARAGVSEYLVKPVEPGSLKAKLESAFKKHSGR